jgi:chromosome partitioning protein
MGARIIAVVNQKGGAGKTTLSMHIAVTITQRGHRVMLVDADPQGTATRWAAAATQETPFPVPVCGLAAAGRMLHREVKKYIHDYDYVVIDCPPALDALTPQSALLVADLAVVPLLPSPLDVWAATGVTFLIENARTVNTTLRALLVLNQCQPRQVLAQEVREQLDSFQIPLARSHLGDRVVYRQAPLLGTSVHSMGREASQAIEEVTSVTDELLQHLEDNYGPIIAQS